MSIDDNNMSVFLEQVADIVGKNSLKRKSLEPLKSLPLSQNECIYVIDFFQNKLMYSKGFYNLLGYTDNEITLDFIESLYHPDDVELTNRIIKASILHTLAHPEDSLNNILFISFRLRKKDGTYIKMLSQSSIYDFDKSGQMTSTLIRFTDISFIDNSQNVNWDFKAPNLNKETFKQQIYKNYNSFFTVRETEIIFEIKNGLTNKQIGKKLNISEHTVATHRKHILKKAVCHNSEQLILFCQGKGII